MQREIVSLLFLTFTSMASGQATDTKFAACTPNLLTMEQMRAKFQGDRGGKKIDEIVLHDTGSPDGRKYEDAVRYMASPDDGRNVSIHYYIGREPAQLVSMVPETKQAFHVKEKGHNVRAIGIEMFKHESDDPEFTDWQYVTVAQLVYSIMYRHKIPFAQVVGHGDIQTNRNDPEGFDWQRFRKHLEEIEACATPLTGETIL